MQYKEADILMTLVAGSLFIGILTIFFVIIIINNYKRNASKHLESIRLIFETQEKERDRIAKDLHDDLGALLSAAKLHTSILLSQSDKGIIESASLSIAEIIDHAVKDLRMIVRNLVPKNIIDNGWIMELKEFKSSFGSGSNAITILQPHSVIRFRDEVEINLYRIVQELINNSVKHAGATETIVSVTTEDTHLVVEVRDNGKGLMSPPQAKGYGLKNIQTRIDSYKGSFETVHGNNSGAHFIIRFEIANLV
jgi:signal transduction histidine kinase